MIEFLKKFLAWIGRLTFMIGEGIGFILLILVELWFVTIIVVFIIIAWYLGLLK